MVTQRPGESRRVGLNAHLLSLTRTYRGAGINGYIYQLLRRLPAFGADGAQGSSLAYTAFLHEPAFVSPVGLAVEQSTWDTRSPWRRIVWEQTRLASLSRGFDLLHGMAYAVPLTVHCPTVITVHDLSFMRFPEAFRPFHRVYLTLGTRASARRAARIVAVSENTRRDVISYCGVAPDRVVVIPNGVTEEFFPTRAAETQAHARRLGLPDRFILYLGTLEPRKNLSRLLDAYSALRRMRGQGHPGGKETPPLILAGGQGWYYDEILRRVDALDLEECVRFPGFVSQEDLPWYYRAAALFVYPSMFEGFGLPVLEAMASGTPVVTTTASSLPEVAGDAALLVDPGDIEQLAAAMNRCLDEPDLVADLRAAGIRRAAGFSWERTAHATADLHRRVLGSRENQV
jgi:glycosyltransferase involved in cell wall biosynthesis